MKPLRLPRRRECAKHAARNSRTRKNFFLPRHNLPQPTFGLWGNCATPSHTFPRYFIRNFFPRKCFFSVFCGKIVVGGVYLYTIEDFRKINKSENIVISLHGQLRLNERNITVDDVMNAINNGEIIEQYPKDFPFPSCLILGLSINNIYIHIVVSMNENHIYLITAYIPNTDKWESDLKTRKERAK